MMDSLKKSPYIPKAGIRNAFGQKQPSGITIFETDMPRRRSLHDLNVQQAVDSCLVQHQPLKPETPINHLEKTNERLREKILKENNMKSLALDKENEIYNDQGMFIYSEKDTQQFSLHYPHWAYGCLTDR